MLFNNMQHQISQQVKILEGNIAVIIPELKCTDLIQRMLKTIFGYYWTDKLDWNSLLELGIVTERVNDPSEFSRKFKSLSNICIYIGDIDTFYRNSEKFIKWNVLVPQLVLGKLEGNSTWMVLYYDPSPIKDTLETLQDLYARYESVILKTLPKTEQELIGFLPKPESTDLDQEISF